MEAVFLIFYDIILAFEFSYKMNSSIGTCVKKLKLTSALLGVFGYVWDMLKPIVVMFGEGDIY